MTGRRHLAAACALTLLAGCGSGGSGNPHRLTAPNAAALHKDITSLRAAAAANRPAAANAALDRFARHVHTRAVAGDFSAAESAALRRLIANTRARIAAEVFVPVPVVTIPPEVVQPPAPESKLDKARKLYEKLKKHTKDALKKLGKGRDK